MWSGYRVVKCTCGCQMVEFGHPCSKLITKVTLLFSCVAKCLFLQLLTFCWSRVSTPLRRRITVIVIDLGQDSSRIEEIGGRREHFDDFFAVEQQWTVTAVCVLSQWTWTSWLRENGTESTRKYLSGEHGYHTLCTAQQFGDLAGSWTCSGGFCVQQLSS